MVSVDKFDFNLDTPAVVDRLSHNKKEVGHNWPIVYIISGDDEAYIGETVNASRRIEQHLQNEDRRKLTEIRIISDEKFNKSVILDLESFLIRFMSADSKYELQNGNSGIRDHEYYDRSSYREHFKEIWNELKKRGVVEKSIREIENSELYKYSPYKTLGSEQLRAQLEIIKALAEHSLDRRTTILVRGGAGTGKTILAIFLMKLFADIAKATHVTDLIIDEYDEIDDSITTMFAYENLGHIKKIGLVIPQKSLQSSVKQVFRSIRNLDHKMVMSPAEVVKNYIATGEVFDLLIVDEAHRLKCRNKGLLANYAGFDKNNRALGLDKDLGTELDWMEKCSRNQILFRDEQQTVRPCDINAEDFMGIMKERYAEPVAQVVLESQWRCEGGKDYVDYIKDIFYCTADKKREIHNYDLRLYRNCEKMVSEIKAKNDEMTLCRVAAGYAWPWDRKNVDKYTIEIQGKKYRWNRTLENWIGKEGSIDEVGCIHTLQGYDLNYAGIIIGNDIRYEKTEGRIFADKGSYYDRQGKSGVSDDPEALRSYLINIYTTLLTRGIKGTYIYVCDDNLREYLHRFIDYAD